MDDAKAFARGVARYLAATAPAPPPPAAPQNDWFTAANASFAAMNDWCEGANESFAGIDKAFGAANRLFDRAFADIDALMSRTEALEAKLAAMAEKAPELRDQLARVAALEQRVSELLASPWHFNFDRLEVDPNGKVRTISTTYEAVAKVIEAAQGFVVVRTDETHSWIIGPVPPDFDLAPELLPPAAAPGGSAEDGDG
jgi:hypothetical protein